jgi:protein involved in polysaccharide export with SLBB domain
VFPKKRQSVPQGSRCSPPRWFGVWLTICILSLSLAPIAQAQVSVATKPIDRIHLGDFIEIDVIGSIEDDWRGKIDDSGLISNYPLLDSPLDVLCRTIPEIERELVESLRRVLKDPVVEIRILDKSDRPLVSMTGAVTNPQRFRLLRSVGLQELLILSGGLTEKADGSVEIIRRSSLGCSRTPVTATDDLQVINLKLGDLIGNQTGEEFPITSGDMIRVVEAPFVTVIGGVRDPQQLRLRGSLTVSRAISSAGGLAPRADRNRLRLYRFSDGQPKTILLDPRTFRHKPENDLNLMPGDVLEVPLKGRKSRNIGPTPQISEGGGGAFELSIRTID